MNQEFILYMLPMFPTYMLKNMYFHLEYVEDASKSKVIKGDLVFYQFVGNEGIRIVRKGLLYYSELPRDARLGLLQEPFFFRIHCFCALHWRYRNSAVWLLAKLLLSS